MSFATFCPVDGWLFETKQNKCRNATLLITKWPIRVTWCYYGFSLLCRFSLIARVENLRVYSCQGSMEVFFHLYSPPLLYIPAILSHLLYADHLVILWMSRTFITGKFARKPPGLYPQRCFIFRGCSPSRPQSEGASYYAYFHAPHAA